VKHLRSVAVKGPIRLDQFLKWAGVSGTGGQAKYIIQSGMISINGEKSESRGKMLSDGDIVEVRDMGSFQVVFGTVERE